MLKIKILLVEDEFIIADNMRRKLENIGYEVTEIASSGEDAIRLAQETKPDLVISDIILEGEMNGIESSLQIRKLLNIPIIYLTAYGSAEMIDKAKITEPYGYLIKPFNEREVYAAVELALHKHKSEKHIVELLKKSEQSSIYKQDNIISEDMLSIKSKDKDQVIPKSTYLSTNFDKRRSNRFPLNLKIEILGNNPQAGEVKNFSRNGFEAVFKEFTCEVNTIFNFNIQVPRQDFTIAATGKILRKDFIENYWEIAVELMTIPAHIKAEILQYAFDIWAKSKKIEGNN